MLPVSDHGLTRDPHVRNADRVLMRVFKRGAIHNRVGIKGHQIGSEARRD
jgi:hypothetical protein